MYPPSEDSYFFAEFIKNYLKKLSKKQKNSLKFLDVGSGSGILAETAKKFKIKNILASDINPKSVKFIKEKGIKAVKSNLFSKIKSKFDLIVFNAPYLPEDKREPKDSRLETTGGKKGDEISLRFLKQAFRHINKNGKIFLLISSLTPLEKIKKFSPKIAARKKLWMEELLILEFK